jgi:adenosylcobinamide kinase/adenosylcobinamide-phosphate guanylyltransferase
VQLVLARVSGRKRWQRDRPNQLFILQPGVRNLNDPQWQAKIQHHQNRRPADWQCLEVPIDLAQTIIALQTNHPNSYLLIDSLGTWLANLLDRDQAQWAAIEQDLITVIANSSLDITLVAERGRLGVWCRPMNWGEFSAIAWVASRVRLA